MKKQLLKTILATALIFSGAATVAKAENAFQDVKSSHWAYSNIETVAKQGLVAGYADGTFKPSANVTRAEFATFLARMFDGTERVTAPFSDVKSNHWAKDTIEEGLALGFIQASDFKNGKFEPNKAMTRSEIAKWLANGLKASNAEYGEIATKIQTGKYTLLPIAEYYKGGLNKSEYGNVGLMLGTGLMSGFEDGSFKATGNTTRAEVATILIRFGEAMKKAPSSFKGLNELVEVATTGTNMLTTTKFTYLGENYFTNVVGKPYTFSRNNAGVGTVERLIFLEGSTGEEAYNNSIFAKMFIEKNEKLVDGSKSIVVFIENSFTSNMEKTTIDAYSNGQTSSFFPNMGVMNSQLEKKYQLTTLHSENWGSIFKKGKKVTYWTNNVLSYGERAVNGLTVNDGSRFNLIR